MGLVLVDGWVVEVADGRLQSVFWKMETSVISIYMSHLLQHLECLQGGQGWPCGPLCQ